MTYYTYNDFDNDFNNDLLTKFVITLAVIKENSAKYDGQGSFM